MALWVELPLLGSSRVRLAKRLATACGAAGVLFASASLMRSGTPSTSGWFATAILAAAVIGIAAVPALRRFGWLSRRLPPVHHASATRLCVDEQGSAFLRPDAGLAIPLEVRHVHLAMGVIWVDAIGHGHRYHLVSGVDLVGDRAWRCAVAWVTWLRRGTR